MYTFIQWILSGASHNFLSSTLPTASISFSSQILSSISATHMCMAVCPSTRAWLPTSSHILKWEPPPSLLLKLPTVSCPLAMSEAFGFCLIFGECWLSWSWAGLWQVTTVTISWFKQQSCCIQKSEFPTLRAHSCLFLGTLDRYAFLY